MVNQVNPKRKGPLVKVRAIEALVVELRAELAVLDELPHPHASPNAGLLTICPKDCPVGNQQYALRATLKCLWNDRQAALEENLKSRQKSVQQPTITLDMYDAAWEKVKDGKAPRKRLAAELLLTRQGLEKWEKRNLPKR
jgi:hypothetical protein